MIIEKRKLFKIRAAVFLILTAIGLTACDSQALRNALNTGEETEREESSDRTKTDEGKTDVIENIESEENNTKSDAGDTITLIKQDGSEVEAKVSVIDESTAESKADTLTLAKELFNDSEYGREINNNCYAYSKLSPEEQTAYNEIYSILDGMFEEVVLSTVDTDVVDKAFLCVMVDHPEIFYVKGYSIGKYMYGDKIDKIAFSGTYTMSEDERRAKDNEVENYITNVIQNAPQADDYEKIKYVYEYLIKNNNYNINADNNQNILSIVENGETVCQGYAKMTQLILNRMGIFCTLVNGRAGEKLQDGYIKDGEAHVWNIVMSDGCYYNIDTTWGDSSYTLANDDEGDFAKLEINYEYMLVPDEITDKTHTAEPVVEMPVCTSMQDNYYVREGLYFSEVNDAQLQNAFAKAYEEGEDNLWLKACDEAVYEELKVYLIDEQHVFDYIITDNVKYVEYPEGNMLLISIS